MEKWIATWAQAHSDMTALCKKKKDVTARLCVPAQIDGTKLRLRLSNHEGKETAKIVGASVCIGSGSFVPVTFSGKKELTLAPKQEAVSDEMAMPVRQGESITVSLAWSGLAVSGNNLPDGVTVSKKGDYTQIADMPIVKPNLMMRLFKLTDVMPLLSAIEVANDADPRVVVCFGDSITQMSFWTKPLGNMLKKVQKDSVVINKGISGNQILNDPSAGYFSMYGVAAVKRFKRDVLEVSGATDVIFALGVNDLNLAKNEDVIKGYGAKGLMDGLLDMNRQAKEAGLRTFVATVTPCGGNRAYHPYIEQYRHELNRMIRESSAFDGVLDYDAAVRDSANPDRMAKAFDSGDHLHPGPVGGQKLAEKAFEIIK